MALPSTAGRIRNTWAWLALRPARRPPQVWMKRAQANATGVPVTLLKRALCSHCLTVNPNTNPISIPVFQLGKQTQRSGRPCPTHHPSSAGLKLDVARSAEVSCPPSSGEQPGPHRLLVENHGVSCHSQHLPTLATGGQQRPSHEQPRQGGSATCAWEGAHKQRESDLSGATSCHLRCSSANIKEKGRHSLGCWWETRYQPQLCVYHAV